MQMIFGNRIRHNKNTRIGVGSAVPCRNASAAWN